jgi:hypothetical protein
MQRDYEGMKSIVQKTLNQTNYNIQWLFQIHIRNIEEIENWKKKMVIVRE